MTDTYLINAFFSLPAKNALYDYQDVMISHLIDNQNVIRIKVAISECFDINVDLFNVHNIDLI